MLMHVVCLDLESVLVPEIWITVAEHTGIDALRLTTRDLGDYDELMAHRLKVSNENDLRLQDIIALTREMEPLPGVDAFLAWLRANCQVAILSDTYYEFAMPIMKRLGYPMLHCHHLLTDEEGRLTGYRLRQRDAKRRSVAAFRSLNYRVIAVGDSYNDTRMMTEADAGIFIRPAPGVRAEFPDFPVANDPAELRDHIEAIATAV
jgi:phosphoserine / homoserine phosphotransferase